MTKKNNYNRREIIGAVGAALTTATIVNSAGETFAQTNSKTVEYRVQKYAYGWNYKQRNGLLALWLEKFDKNPVKITVASPTNHHGYTAILKEKDVFLNTDGWLHSGMDTID